VPYFSYLTSSYHLPAPPHPGDLSVRTRQSVGSFDPAQISHLQHRVAAVRDIAEGSGKLPAPAHRLAAGERVP